MVLSELASSWQELVQQFTDDHQLLEALWQEIKTRYQEPHRHYHTLTHLADLFTQLQQFKEAITDVPALSFAIWYHDIIYQSTSKKNEEKSAELAVLRLRELGLDEGQLQQVYDWIIATKTHELSAKESSLDLAYLLDFDLVILGREPARYQEYARQIRQEYRLIPGILYRPGRKKVLQHLLDQEWIYKTPPYRERYEEAARYNLLEEIKGL